MVEDEKILVFNTNTVQYVNNSAIRYASVVQTCDPFVINK
jgi:hypothetical protein